MVCWFVALGCEPRHPALRALPDGGALTPVDVVEARDAPALTDLGAAVDLGVAVDLGEATDVPLPMEDDRPIIDAGSAEDAAAQDVPDDVAMDVAADVTADVAPDVTADVTTDVTTDVAVDVRPADVGAPNRWRLAAGEVVYTPWRSSAPTSTAIVRRECGDGQVLVGLTTWASEYVSGIAARCARLNTDGTLGTSTLSARVGATYNTSQDDSCPAGQVIVRFGGGGGAVIDRLQETCAPVATWLTSGELGVVLRRHGDGAGGAAFEDTCPAGYIGAGFEASVRTNFDFFRDRIGTLRLRCIRLLGETL